MGAVEQIDAVVHLAGVASAHNPTVDPTTYFAVNKVGTRNLVDAISELHTGARRPVSVIFISTAWVYRASKMPLSEESPTDRSTPYGASKLAAEEIVSAASASGAIGAISLRAFNIAGAVEGQPDNNLTRLIPRTVAVASGRLACLDINNDDTSIREYLHVEDFAAAVPLALSACEPGKHHIYNIGSGLGLTVPDVVRITEQVTKRPVRTRFRASPAERCVLLSNTYRIRARLGWQPRRSMPSTIIDDAWQAEISRHHDKEDHGGPL